MADVSIIKEFLVKLGFTTDEGALDKFDKGIAKATRTVISLAAAVEGTAVVVAAGVARFASNLEALYFASQRTETSATNIKAFDMAAQNFGATAGEATAAIESLAHALRVNPGNEGVIHGLGVQTRDAKGHLLDLTDVMLDLGKVFAKQPMFIAEQYASMLGINERTLLALRSGAFAKELEHQRELMKNSGYKQATEDAHAFMVELRQLGVVVEAFGLKVYDALSRKLGMSMAGLTSWLQTNGPRLAEQTADVILRIIDVAEKLAGWIGKIVDKLMEWDKSTDGWSTKLLGLLVVLKMFGGFEIIAGVVKLAGAFGTLGVSMASAVASGSGLVGILGRLGLIGAAGAGGYFLGGKIYDNLSSGTQNTLGEGIARLLAQFGNRNAKESLAANNPMAYLQDLGWTREQVAGILANLQAESGMNPNAVGDHGNAFGLAQWHKDRQAVFAKIFGHEMTESTRSEQLDFLDYELKRGAERSAGALLRAATNSRQAAEIIARNYERPANMDLAAKERGDMAVQISQKTDIHVHGQSSPEASAQQVARQQQRVNSDLTRNFQVAVN